MAFPENAAVTLHRAVFPHIDTPRSRLTKICIKTALVFIRSHAAVTFQVASAPLFDRRLHWQGFFGLGYIHRKAFDRSC